LTAAALAGALGEAKVESGAVERLIAVTRSSIVWEPFEDPRKLYERSRATCSDAFFSSSKMGDVPERN